MSPNSETVKTPFPRLTYDQAVEILQKASKPVRQGDDFDGGPPTPPLQPVRPPEWRRFHRYPASIKAFYMEPDPQRPELALGFDMLASEDYSRSSAAVSAPPATNCCSSACRENNLPEEAFQVVSRLAPLRRALLAGPGLGLGRTVAWICGTEHIRESVPFPRPVFRVYPPRAVGCKYSPHPRPAACKYSPHPKL